MLSIWIGNALHSVFEYTNRVYMYLIPFYHSPVPGGGGGGGGGGGHSHQLSYGGVPLYRVDFERPISLK